jgi:hypothetical protein
MKQLKQKNLATKCSDKILFYKLNIQLRPLLLL